MQNKRITKQGRVESSDNDRSKDIINDCQFYFNCDSVSHCVTKGQINFYVNMLRLKIYCVLQFVHYKRMIL